MKTNPAVALAVFAAGALGGVAGALLIPSAHSQAQPAAQVGRYVKIGITPSSQSWRASHSADTSIIWSMDSTTGAILGCGDATGTCTVVAGSVPRR